MKQLLKRNVNRDDGEGNVWSRSILIFKAFNLESWP
jgi:hypothetical protein